MPFTSVCAVKSICVSGDDRAPLACRLWVNREGLGFAEAEDLPPTQAVDLVEDPAADVWHPLRAAKFGGVSSLDIFLAAPATGAEARVFYVGFKGVATRHKRVVVEAVYESRPQLSDHAARADQTRAAFGS